MPAVVETTIPRSRFEATGERPAAAGMSASPTDPIAVDSLMPSEWAGTSAAARCAWVRRFRDVLVARADELLQHVEAEVHKPRWEALTSDLLPLLAACKWHERHAPRLLRGRSCRGGAWWSLGQSHRIGRAPLGRVGIIATWNYPVQLLGVQLVQALVAGNDVVVKPSERSPRTQAMLLEIAQQAGLPAGTLRTYAATREAGQEMLAHERLDHLMFTGSTSVGREIAAIAASRLLPTTLELSGRDSAIVLADADPSLAARSIWNAVTMNAGQTCMAPRRVLVERSVYHAFVSQLARLAAGAGPRRLIDPGAARECYELSCEAVAAGGRSLSGVLEAPRADALVPLAIADCPRDAALISGRHFGPVLAVAPVSDVDDALRLHAEASEGHVLATAVFTRDVRGADRLASRLGSAIVTVNDCVVPTGDPRVSISGRGPSGWGPSRGEAGLLALTRPVHIARTSTWFRLPLTVPTSAAADRIGRFMLRRYETRR